MKPYEHAAAAIWFETFFVEPIIAIANLGEIPASAFEPGAKPFATDLARWVSRSGENSENFRHRIRADLKAEGVKGVLVSVYEHSAHWNRNVIDGKAFPPPAPQVEKITNSKAA